MDWDDYRLHLLAGDFFRTFSRMEYALKATRFMVPNQRNAKADWVRFADAIRVTLDDADEEVRRSIDFILAEPPRKQVNNNGQIQWVDTPPDAEHQAELVLRYICRVRNNLFHGGKFNGQWFQPERSGELIKAALVVLNHCRDSCPEVSEVYRD